MGVRPPTTGGNEDRSAVVFGIAEVDERLDGTDVSFPATAEELAAALGDAEVRYDAEGHTMSVSTAVERTQPARFDSRTHLLNELHPVFESERQQRGFGVLSWLRSVVPSW